MRQALISIAAGLLLLPAAGLAADGKAVFDKGGCGLCHKANQEGVGPSLGKIASAYAGKKDALLRFLNAEADPIMLADKFAVMKPSLLKTKALPKDEQGALAEYLLSQK